MTKIDQKLAITFKNYFKPPFNSKTQKKHCANVKLHPEGAIFSCWDFGESKRCTIAATKSG